MLSGWSKIQNPGMDFRAHASHSYVMLPYKISDYLPGTGFNLSLSLYTAMKDFIWNNFNTSGDCMRSHLYTNLAPMNNYTEREKSWALEPDKPGLQPEIQLLEVSYLM